MKIKFCSLQVVAAVLLFSLSQTLADPPVTFEVLANFDYPLGYGAFAGGINTRGDVAGSFEFSTANFQGFIRFVDHLSGPIADPNSGENNSTHVYGINDNGTICGSYVNGVHSIGFLASGGIFTDVSTDALDNSVTGVNNEGNTCGYSSNPIGAFVIIDGEISSFIVPGSENGGSTAAFGINNLNQCVGYFRRYQDLNVYGFRRDADGTMTYPIGDRNTLSGINDRGWMVGATFWDNGVHGALFQTPNKMVQYDYPGAGALEGGLKPARRGV